MTEQSIHALRAHALANPWLGPDAPGPPEIVTLDSGRWAAALSLNR